MGRNVLDGQVAPLWKRQLAGLIDALPSFVLLVLFVRRRRSDAHVEQSLVQQLAGADQRLIRQLELVHAAYGVMAPVVFGQTFGQRALRIRVVGQDTGRRPALSQSIIRWGLDGGPPMILNFLPKSTTRRQLFEDVVAGELEELKARHEGDNEALTKAMHSLFKERGVSPLGAYLPDFLRLTFPWLYEGLMFSTSLRDPLNQSIGERMAKTFTVAMKDDVGTSCCLDRR